VPAQPKKESERKKALMLCCYLFAAAAAQPRQVPRPTVYCTDLGREKKKQEKSSAKEEYTRAMSMPWLILFQLGQGFATVGITARSLGVSPSLASVLLFPCAGKGRRATAWGGL